MAALKWIFVVLFGLGSAGALGMAFVSGGVSRTPSPRTSPPIALRQFPVMVAAVGTPKAPDVAAPEPAAKPPEPAPEAAKPEPEAAKPEVAKPEPVKPEPVAAKPPEPAAKPPAPAAAPAVAKPPAPVAKAPEPAAKPPEPKAEPEVAKPPAPKPEPVAAKPAPADGLLNLRATDTADVYLDGKKLGGSPLLGVKAKAGNHKVRFDCYDAAGNTVAGPVQVIAVKAEAEVDVEYPCPVE